MSQTVIAPDRAAKAEHTQAAYERWIQAELTGDPSLTALRILYNDLRRYDDVRPETWDYFDLQEQTGGAESMDTQHITELTGHYDPETDEIVAAVAGGERVTYDQFTVSGLQRAQERAAQNPDFTFQVTRDQIYRNNYNGVVKDMWRGRTKYDTVIYGSTFPQDLIDALGERGRMIVQDLAYDDTAKKGFIYGFRKLPNNNMEFFAARIANATPDNFAAYLHKNDIPKKDFKDVDSHQYGNFVITTNTAGQTLKEVALQEVGKFDLAATERTGTPHYFGRDQSGTDAYELFKRAPKLWQAYRQYHRLLAHHFTGAPLSDELYAYLTNAHETTGFHVLDPHEQTRLGLQLDNQKITADMALACKKLMTYAHYATLNKLLDDYHRTGEFADITGDDILQAYGATAGGNGGEAAARGDTFNDCDTVYGESATSAAAELAAREGITLEEALRRLGKKSERWSEGECRNCERTTQIWKEEDGGCNVCRKCANEHTVWGQQGLDREKRRAQAEREVHERFAALVRETTTPEPTAAKADVPIGTTRYVHGQQHMLTRRTTVGGAQTVWINTATGKPVDEV